jgi:hypothetical protein
MKTKIAIILLCVSIASAAVFKRHNTSSVFIEPGAAFANIHVHNATATAQNIDPGALYTPVSGFADDGGHFKTEVDLAFGSITIINTGWYKISHNSSFTGDTNNVSYFLAVFADGVEQDNLHFVRKLGTAGDVGSGSFSGLLEVTAAPVDLDIRVRYDNSGVVEYTMEYANFTVTEIGR